jgi:hypothetical protein
MSESTRVHPLIRYPVAVGLACFAAWRLVAFAKDVGLLKGSVEGPIFPYIAEYAVERILFTVLLVFPALYLADWLLKSPTRAITISLAALIFALWLTVGGS